MATRNQATKQTAAGNKQSTSGGSHTGNKQEATQSTVAVEQHVSRTMSMGPIKFETVQGNDGLEHIKMTGDGIDESTLNPTDIDTLSRFFSRNVRYNGNQRRVHGAGQLAVTDGRGMVNDPSTDSRLKGNEDQRPNDNTGARRAGHPGVNS